MGRFIGFSLMALALAQVSFAGMAMEHPQISVDENGVIMNGYDAVAYFTDKKAVKGSTSYMAVHDGAIYLFASKKHRAAFVEDPSKYAPQFGGWCAYGVALGKKFPVDGEAFDVRGGKLYLNLDKKIQKKWAENPAQFVKDATSKWPGIVSTPADKLKPTQIFFTPIPPQAAPDSPRSGAAPHSSRRLVYSSLSASERRLARNDFSGPIGVSSRARR